LATALCDLAAQFLGIVSGSDFPMAEVLIASQDQAADGLFQRTGKPRAQPKPPAARTKMQTTNSKQQIPGRLFSFPDLPEPCSCNGQDRAIAAAAVIKELVSLATRLCAWRAGAGRILV
jgi:hypothetical protein